MFRLNRINPHGCACRRNARSSDVTAAPDKPVMKAREAMTRDYRALRGSARMPAELFSPFRKP